MIYFSESCYEGVVNTSEDGRGPSTRIGYFSNFADALKAVKGRSSWGSDGTVNKTTIEIKIYQSYEEFESISVINEYNNVLAKLSPRERQILGLTPKSINPQPPTPPEDRILVEGKLPQKP